MRPTRLRGARTHNLRDVDLDLEPGTLVAIAGPSGAGKSSLAFSTLYAEGQRRYVESFSAYARQFLERLARPPVAELEPVPVGIAVDRQAPVRTSRSTVGTMTDVADYLKTLFARASVLHCPGCGLPVLRDDPQRAADDLLAAAPQARVVVTYPLPAPDAEAYLVLRDALVTDGYRRLRLDDGVRDVDEVPPSDAVARGAVDVVADRTVARPTERSRLVEAIEAAMRRSEGRADVWVEGAGCFRYSRGLHCPRCDLSFRDPNPGLFSFNSPVGACEACRGFGRTIGIDLERVIPDRSKTLAGGAIKAFSGKGHAWERRQLKKHADARGVPMDVPVEALAPAQWRWLLDGDGRGWRRGWWGVLPWFRWMESRAYRMHVRVFLSRYRKYDTCEACGGDRLKPEARAFRVAGRSLPELGRLPVAELRRVLDEEARPGADPATLQLLRECDARLGALCDVGLGYLTLSRASRTLSGGEAQRVALTGALGAALTGAMFVLDEPTVGLHPRDVERLVTVVRRLCLDDNVAVVVEHDAAVLGGADRVVELGPGSGEAGGRVVFDGTPAELRRADTATGRALRAPAAVRRSRRAGDGAIELTGAGGHNLRGVDLRVPRGALTCVTGVSGSGKSSLVFGTLLPAVRRALGEGGRAPLPFEELRGLERVVGIVAVDQSPLGRTSRGNPATYLKAWDVVRKRFAAEPLSRSRGYAPGFFSFNVPGGRCEACRGEGAETVEMQFLADVTFTCPECDGRRFLGAVLEVTHRGLTIADVLQQTAREAAAAFADDRQLQRRLRPLIDVGLGYLRLGQPLSALSGGEAQRLKLAQALVQAEPGSLLLLDEPTAGLHPDDVTPLLEVFDRLVERGDTVVVVEHDMRVVAEADHVVDLGPGAGAAGGRVVAAGTPEAIARHPDSQTALYLSRALGLAPPAPRPRRPRRARTPHHGAIEIAGAREHNLRDVTVRVPREQLVVVTGPSGSGKSTLAFDVLFAEGQRRYLETLSPYARQYMPQLPRPDVDRVVGVPACVSLEQRSTHGAGTSTVATLTEVSHYLRLLWARVGELSCPDCGEPIAARSAAELAAHLRERFGPRAKAAVLAPVVRGRKGIHRELLADAHAAGVRRARVDGALVDVVPGMKLERYREHDVDLLIGETRIGDPALAETLATALRRADGTVRVLARAQELVLSSRRACPSCGAGFPELDPRFFSFNTRQGACEKCEGRGAVLERVGRGKRAREVSRRCDACAGTRLSELARAVSLDGVAITDVLSRSVSGARERLRRIAPTGRAATVAEAPLAELDRRLSFLMEVGLGYLGLDRSASTLSGGEMQRVRLAAQLGSGLTGVLYVLDEPTIGLHPRDTGRLLAALRRLVEAGNSVLVVEHDADTIRAADHVIDVGPGGGRHGGRVVAEGPAATVLSAPGSITGAALRRPAPVPESRRPVSEARWLELAGATAHNLREVDARFPVGRLTAVTGVSGSGKSTLVREVLLRAARAALGLVAEPAGAHASLSGVEAFDRAVEVDQTPIGRTPRSVPATYVGVWDVVRKLLAGTPAARARGYGPSRFSFNVRGGRCDGCDGAGARTVEMAFLPDVLVPCEACGGTRFDPETLAVTFHDLSVGQILDRTVTEARDLFGAVPKVRRPLELMDDLGLGYLKLGQASNTLSGGEAQRMKLVAELGGASSRRTLYVMDEPTTGLHRDDVARLLAVLQRLVDRGDSVVVIEHHPDVILASDWVVDLGPEGGEGGGRVVVAGTPEEVMACPDSHTGAAIAAARA